MEPTAQYPVLILITETNVNRNAPVSMTCVMLLQDANMLTEVFSLVHFFSIKQCISYYTKIFLQNECIIQCETRK